MTSSITTFIATALVLFTLGQALAEPARTTAHAPHAARDTNVQVGVR